MPFGLCNAPATFQCLMETMLAGLIRDKCIAYIDDILVMGETLEDPLYVQNLQRVLQGLREAGLKLKPSKCHFLQRSVEYLGHVISEKGISPDPRKVEAVRNFPVLTTYFEITSIISGVGIVLTTVHPWNVLARFWSNP